jgi:hypothetical protein
MLAIVMFSAMFLSKPTFATFVQPQPWMEINQIDSDLPLTWMKYPNFLILPTDGSKGCVHPDVLYFPDGKDGYNFWMIYTPYPDNAKEQPFIVRSNNGINWTGTGIINPVIQAGVHDFNYDHQADPAWCYIPEYDKFFLVWTACPNNFTANIAIAYSTDAQDWHFDAFGSNREPILVENAGTPTIVYKNGIFQVWYNSGGLQYLEPVYYLTFQWDNTDNRVINQSSSQGPWFPASNETASLFLGHGHGLTHVSVVCSGDDYYLYGSCYPAGADVNYTLFQNKILHCWKGTPPLNFTDYGTLLSPNPFGWDSMMIYKSVLLTDCYGNLVTPNNQFWLYYSGYGNSTQGGERLMPHIGLATAPYEEPLFHDVAVVSVSSSKTVVGQMCNCFVDATVFNKGDFTETFKVTVYANTTVVGTQTVNNISNNTSTLLNFTWNTTNFAYGNYTLWACAWSVTDERNTGNNNCTSDKITAITIPGDIDGNFKVNLADLVALAQAYGSRPSDNNWNPNADVDGNNVVGLSDLVALAQHYGQHYP